MYTLSSLDRPFQANFEITNRCNLDCFFCSAELRKHFREELPTKSVLKMIAKLADNNIYSVFLTGGEPLLRKDLPEIIKECFDLGIKVSLSTNGIAANKSTCKALTDVGLEEIQVSIHAPNQIHDKMVGAGNSINNAFEGLTNLVQIGLSVIVAAVPTKMNHQLLPDLAMKVQQLGARCFRVLRLMPHSETVLQQIVSYACMKELVERLTRVRSEADDFVVSVHTTSGFSEGEYDLENWERILHPLSHTCSAAKVSMGILPDGNCVPCLEIKGSEMNCGNILRQPLSEIWFSEPMTMLRHATPDRYKGRCSKCKLKWTCYSARCIAYNLNDDILGDDISCYLLQSDQSRENCELNRFSNCVRSEVKDHNMH